MGLYIFEKPKAKFEKEFNDTILTKAELIRCKRQEAVINEEFGFLDWDLPKKDFLEFFKEKAKEHYQKGYNLSTFQKICSREMYVWRS